MAQKVTSSTIEADKRDDIWAGVVYEIAMNYSLESLRYGYGEEKKRKKGGERTTSDKMRLLGFSEEDIARSNTKD